MDYRFVFEPGTNGSYEFVCEPHEQLGMVGEITVLPMNETQDGPGETESGNSESSKEQSYFTSYGLGLIVLSVTVLLLFRYEALKSIIFRKK